MYFSIPVQNGVLCDGVKNFDAEHHFLVRLSINLACNGIVLSNGATKFNVTPMILTEHQIFGPTKHK